MAVNSSKNLKISMPLSPTTKIPVNEIKSIKDAKKLFFIKLKNENNSEEKIELHNIRAMLCWVSRYDVILKKVKQKMQTKSIYFIISFEDKEKINECINNLKIHVPKATTEIIN